MYTFTYTVVFCDEVERKNYRQEGVGLANSYAHAADQLEQFYGITLNIIEEIKLYEYSSLIPLSKDVVAKIREELNDSMPLREEVV